MLHLIGPKPNSGRRSFVHRSAVAWNALPDNLKDSPNSRIFKYNLKQSKRTIMNINFGKGGNVIYNTKPDFIIAKIFIGLLILSNLYRISYNY